MNKTSIEWTDYTWNPVTGCTKVSTGCKNCYAERMANRFKKSHGDFKTVTLHPERILQPITKKLPPGTRVFVCDVSDLFHRDVPFKFINEVFRVMAKCPLITFQVLTKRPDRALEWSRKARPWPSPFIWPLRNVWIGTSCENQETANERIKYLIQIDAAKRFLSCEPLLGPIQIIVPRTMDYIDWIIAGGESGPRARPMNPDWVRSIRDQCESAHIPFFFKQWGEWIPDPALMPSSLGPSFIKVGKSKSGNVLDGKQHLAFPA